MKYNHVFFKYFIKEDLLDFTIIIEIFLTRDISFL